MHRLTPARWLDLDRHRSRQADGEIPVEGHGGGRQPGAIRRPNPDAQRFQNLTQKIIRRIRPREDP